MCDCYDNNHYREEEKSAEKLAGLADEALTQIDDNRYDAEMKEDGIQDILKLGIAFSGKNVSVKTVND